MKLFCNMHIPSPRGPFAPLMRHHKPECCALCSPLRGGALYLVQLLRLPKGTRRRKGDREEGLCPALSASCRCRSSLSLPTSQVSQPTRLNHTATRATHMCAHLHLHTRTHTLFHTPRSDSPLPPLPSPSFPRGNSDSGARGVKEEKDRT